MTKKEMRRKDYSVSLMLRITQIDALLEACEEVLGDSWQERPETEWLELRLIQATLKKALSETEESLRKT